MPVPEIVAKYVVDGIEGTPRVMRSILEELEADDARWDERPDPERFTLREMIAHVADWDPIFLGRIERMLNEDFPTLESVDEGVLCKERSYHIQNPLDNLDRLAQSRPKVVHAVRTLREADWERMGHREFVGEVNLFQLATMILGHDAYHLRQAAEYLAS